MQRVVLLRRLRVWGALRCWLVLLPACTRWKLSTTCLITPYKAHLWCVGDAMAMAIKHIDGREVGWCSGRKMAAGPALPSSMPALSPTEDTESSLWVTTACGGNIQCPCCLAYGNNVLLLGDILCRGYEPVNGSYPLTHRSASQGHCSQLQCSQQEQEQEHNNTAHDRGDQGAGLGALCHDAAAPAVLHALTRPPPPDPSFQCQHWHALQAGTPSYISLHLAAPAHHAPNCGKTSGPLSACTGPGPD